MRQEDLNPPAIVKQQSVDVAALDKSIKAQAITLRQNRRRTLEQAVELGRLLAQRKAICNAGEWTPYLQKQGLAINTAAEYMRVGSLTDNELEDMNSISEALAYERSKREGMHEPCIQDESTPYYEEDESEIIGLNEDPPPEPHKPKPDMQIRCDRCIRLHVVEPCSECIRLRVEAKAAAKFTSPATPPRSHSAKPKNGQEAWEFKLYDKAIGQLVRTTDEMLKMAGLMTSPVEEAFRRLYTEALKLAKETWKKAQDQTNGS